MIKKYVDSNIIIHPLLYEDEKADRCKNFLKKVASKKEHAICSYLAWDEIFYVVKRSLGKSIALVESKKLLNFPNLNFISVNKQIIYRAQELLEKYDLNPRDAIHAATVILNDAEIVTFDSNFDKIKELKKSKF